MTKKRDAWRAGPPAPDPAELVSIGETCAGTTLARTHGPAPRGERSVEAVPRGPWHTTTSVGGRRADGFVAPMVVDGAINGDLFRAYVEKVLAPELRPGGVVIRGDLGRHGVAGVRAAGGRAGGRVAFLPPYSPDLNPIGRAFSKLKGLLRKAAERTVEGLWERIGKLLDQFPPDECRNYLRHCGYAATPT